MPKAIADRYRIRPGDDIDRAPTSDVIRVNPPGKREQPENRKSRLVCSTRRPNATVGVHLLKQSGLAFEAGEEKISTPVAALVDANVLLHGFNRLFPNED